MVGTSGLGSWNDAIDNEHDKNDRSDNFFDMWNDH